MAAKGASEQAEIVAEWQRLIAWDSERMETSKTPDDVRLSQARAAAAAAEERVRHDLVDCGGVDEQ